MRPMLLIALLMLAGSPVAAQDDMSPIENMRLYPETALVADGQAQAAVVYSAADAAAADAARELHRELEARCGVPFPLVADSEVCPERLAPVGEEWRETNLIVVGNLYANRAILPLYALYFCGADSVYPGGDGYELRTVSNPWGTGRNVIVVGGSSVEGMRAGVAALLERLPEAQGGEVVLPRLHQVEPDGDMVAMFSQASGRVQPFPEPTRQQDIHRFWQAAYRYHWTGDERWAEIARDNLRWFNDHFREGKYAVSDYTTQHLFRAWDVLEESPVLTDDDRLTAIGNMVTTALTMPRYGESGNWLRVGGTHSTVPRWAIWRFARYLQRTLPDHPELMEISQRWEEKTVEYFEEVTKAFRDDSDWRAASVDVFVRWSAAAQQYDYFTSGNARAATLWAVNENDPLGYHNGMGTYGAARTGAIYTGFSNLYIIQLAAFMYDDPRLRWLSSHLPNRNLSVYAYGYFPFNACAWTPDPGATGEEPEYLTGLTIVPLSERRHKYVFGFEGRAVPPPAQCFDKACFRSGFDPEDQYLLLQGVNGTRSQNANVIPRHTDRGQVWLVSNSSQKGHYYRTALYLSDGRNEGELPGACRLDAAGRFADAAMVASTLTEYHGCEWQRSVFWQRGEWFLVMDRATAVRPGFYAAQSVWRMALAGTWRDDHALTATQEGKSFHIIASAPVQASARFEQPAGGPPDVHEHPFFLRERKSGELTVGEALDFQNLLVTTEAGEAPRFDPVRVSDSAALVRSGTGAVLVGSGGAEPALGIEADAGLFAASESAVHVAGVSRLRVDGEVVLASEEPLTARVDLKTGEMQIGHDGDELRASALTWELREGERTQLMDAAAAQALGQRITGKLAQVAAPAAQIPETPPAVRAQIGPQTFETIWESEQAGYRARPIEGLSVSIPDAHNGRALALVDGVAAFQTGAVSWEADQAATVEMTWPDEQPIGELRVWMRNLGGRNDMEKARSLDEEREVTLTWSSDGFREDLREQIVTVRAQYRAFATYKGTVQPQKVLRVPAEDAEATGVRLTIAAGTADSTDWHGNVVSMSEVEVLVSERGPLTIQRVLREDLDGDGKREWLMSADDCSLSVVDDDGALVWRKQFASEVSGLDIGDLDGDGRPEVLCCSYDMYVYAFAADGSPLWQTDVTGLRKGRPELFTQEHPSEYGPVPFSVAFWEPRPGMRRVLLGGYESTLCLLDERGKLLQVYYPGYSMFHRSSIREAVDLNGDGLREKLICSMKYGAFGVLHALIADADGMIAGDRRTSLPDNLPWVQELVGERRDQAVIITPVGFGLYDLSANFPEQQHRMGQPNGVWEVQGGRPVSAGLLHDLDGDGAPELVVGGSDGFLSLFSLDGECLSVRLIGEAVNDIAAVGAGDDLTLIVATDSGLTAWDRDWQVRAALRGGYTRLEMPDPGRSRLLAVTADGRLQLLELGGEG
jgi:hypothetical protein